MVKEKENKKVSYSLVEAEVKNPKKKKNDDKKTVKKQKKKDNNIKKQKKKELKKEKRVKNLESKKKTKNFKKRKPNVLSITIIILSLLFIIAGIIALLYGIGVLDFELKDPGPNYYVLSEKVKVGDYVLYDAGNWDEDTEVPNRNAPYTFGGYTKDLSRNNGVNCNYNEEINNGWRVFSIEEDKVTLIHAGISMCYYHGYGNGTNDTSINILSNLNEESNFDYFLDEKYSESVRILTKEDIDKFVGSDSSYARIRNDLINVGNPYWLASKNGTHYMWYVTEGGSIASDHVGTYGVRVVVTLKKNVKTTGVDKKGNWLLADDVKKDE